MNKDEQNGLEKTNAQGKNQVLRNVAKIIFMAAVLGAAWFVLEWLFGMK